MPAPLPQGEGTGAEASPLPKTKKPKPRPRRTQVSDHRGGKGHMSLTEGVKLTLTALQCGRQCSSFDGLPDHLGRLIEDGRRNGEAQCLGRLQVEDQFELLRPLNGEVPWLRTLQDFVYG